MNNENGLLSVALCGNPNVGKSTVFNGLTGLRQHTGNWAGKTVETAAGRVKDGDVEWELTDLPGTYSLLSGSPEEEVACDFLCFAKRDAVIVVCDATCLERNLNVTLQVVEAAGPVVVCVNLMDEARKSGMELDLQAMEALLGVPVVGVCARSGQGMEKLKTAVTQAAHGGPERESKKDGERPLGGLMRYPLAVESGVRRLMPALKRLLPENASLRFIALRMLAAGTGFLESRLNASPEGEGVRAAYQDALAELEKANMAWEDVVAAVVSAGYAAASRVCACTVKRGVSCRKAARQLRIDRILCSKAVGIPLMLCLLGAIFYLTLSGANAPSAWLSETLLGFQPALMAFLAGLGAPGWLQDMLVMGMYRVAAWVVAVMLPPMAIFFPLFTLLEDLGVLPRIAFNLDRCFKGCKACGKQALCMCMGLGCNAVGVTGCRIIQSPRERLIAILTNAFTPCNGRFPLLISLIGMFFVAGAGAGASLGSAALLVGLMTGSVGMTLLCSFILSRTVLKGVPSAFTLELPPIRKPKWGQVVVRSMLDRTLFVLGRAVAVAAPAGLILWVLAHVSLGGETLLAQAAAFLDPMGRLMGLDGVILLGFVLGFPANEIVLPVILMTYLSQGVLMEPLSLEMLKALLVEQGWTVWTAVSMTVFTLFHWPCSTTTWTLYKETKSLKWTALAVALPTAAGVGLCMAVAVLGRLAG